MLEYDDSSLEDELEGEDPERDRLRPRAADLLRKAVLSGVGALFMTEEGVRSLVKELKLPKEVLAGAIAQADRTKDEVVRIIGKEVRSFLQSDAVREEFVGLLTDLTFEVRAEIGIKRKGDGSSALDSPSRAKVTVKRKSGSPKAKGAPKKGSKKATAT